MLEPFKYFSTLLVVLINSFGESSVTVQEISLLTWSVKKRRLWLSVKFVKGTQDPKLVLAT